ncbi:MAG: ferrichrome ABC transporter permease, partial [Anaerolineae bacterium]|nr:ferrichrome ABC transporter permease [Anaerolineae bacterium]
MIDYLITIVLSAFLLFFVQPLIGKVILPWFGGSASVWSALLLFFQFVLLLGYTYSYLITVKLKRRQQMIVHAGVVASSLVLLGAGLIGDAVPMIPSSRLKPGPETVPIIRILLILGSSVGLPYFALSTTSPLLQAWYAKDAPGRTPYWLYALSNAGSFTALVGYPFIIEPLLDLPAQAW